MGALLATPWSRTRTRLPAWRALLTCRGQKLWQMRRALPAKNLLILGPVCLVRDAATFLDLERRGLIDAKGKPWANGCPLTAASEDVWRRQRRAIVRELPSALARSVACGEAAASRILAAAPGAADLRAVLDGGHARVAGSFAAAASGAASAAAPVFVTFEDSARGLHFDGVDAVFVPARPRSADEYLHLAGRTGRCGAAGEAISIVTYREADALKGWANQLEFALTKDSEFEAY